MSDKERVMLKVIYYLALFSHQLEKIKLKFL